MAQLVDAGTGRQPEREWLVVTARDYALDNRTGGGMVVEREANVTVKAAAMEIVDGALVFRTPTGELSWAFGPGGWLEVSRA